jgi:hypothetical protein
MNTMMNKDYLYLIKFKKIFENISIVIYLVVVVRIYEYHWIDSILIDSNDSDQIEQFVLDRDVRSIAIEMKPVYLNIKIKL